MNSRYDEESHVLTMTFERAMKKGSKVTLIIVFQSQLNDKDVGMFMFLPLLSYLSR